MRNFAAVVGCIFALSLLARADGPQNTDRQKVVDDMLPLTQKAGNAEQGKAVFSRHCASCHVFGSEGNKVGPDLTAIGVQRGKRDILIRILDPNRDAQRKLRFYHVTMRDGRVVTGVLASESKSALEVIDAQAKKHSLAREEIEDLVVTFKSMMAEGFEKSVTADEIVNLLAFLSARGQFLPLPLDKAATIVSTKGMFNKKDADEERLIFDDWGPKTFKGVPFHLVDPQGDTVLNVILLYSKNGKVAATMPKAVKLPCNAPAKTIHMLSGVSGWGYPYNSKKGGVVLTVRLHYVDGETENHNLINGEHFADYIKRNDVPGSEFAFALRNQQMRYLAVQPKREEVITEIEFIKGPDASAPIVMAVTVEAR